MRCKTIAMASVEEKRSHLRHVFLVLTGPSLKLTMLQLDRRSQAMDIPGAINLRRLTPAPTTGNRHKFEMLRNPAHPIINKYRKNRCRDIRK